MNDEPPITIVIPVFREEPIISQTCAFFLRIVERSPSCDLVICGTARERRDDVNPTLKLAEAALRDHPRGHVIECPAIDGLKADQLQFSFKQGPQTSNSLFGIYDVDSRPDQSVISEVRSLFTSTQPDIIQQHALFVGNLRALRQKPIQLGQALYQSRWTLTHEIPRFQLYRLNITPFVHLVGHGLFVQKGTIDSFGGIPTGTIVDDAHLGLFATASRLKIASLSSFDVSDNPESLGETFQQLLGWSRGPLDISSYLSSYGIAGLRVSRKREISITLASYVYWFQWVATTPVIVILSVMAITGRTAAVVWLLLYLSDFLLAFLVIKASLPQKELPNPLYAISAMFLFASLCSIPAFVAAFSKLLNIRVSKYKTSHRTL